MVDAEVDPKQLVFFVDEMGVHTSLAPLCMVTLEKANACTCRFHAIAAKTPRFWPLSPLAGWARRWPLRALYDSSKSSRPMYSAGPGTHTGSRTGGDHGQPLCPQTG